MLFEKLVEKFPTCGRFWRIYIEQEVSLHDTYVEYNIIGIAGHLLEHQLVSVLPIESLHALLTVIAVWRQRAYIIILVKDTVLVHGRELL